MRSKSELIELLKLNNEQADIVLDTHHETIVPAGAGSGKTKTLVAKIIELLTSGYKIDSFLVLTFTNKAAAEMKDRVKNELRNNPSLSHLANQVDSSHIQTFDSFAYNFVKQNATALNKDSNLELLDSALFASVKYELMNDLVIKLLASGKYDSDDVKYLSNLTAKSSEETFVSSLVKVYDKLDSSFNISQLNSSIISNKQIVIDTNEISNAIKEINYDFYVKYQDDLEAIFTYTNQLLDLNNSNPLKIVKYPSFRWANLVSEDEKKQIVKLLDPIKSLIKGEITKENLADFSQLFDTYQAITLEIIYQFHQQLSTFKRKVNKYEFNDIANFLIEILTNNPDVLKRLKEKFEFIFIDEFQDTSKIQSDFLDLLIANNDFAKVLYVGDIKQSIYKFRNAVPENFIAKQKVAHQIPLAINYRSSSEIIDFVNKVFTQLLTNEEKHDIKYHPDHIMLSGSVKYKSDTKAGVYLEVLASEDPEKIKVDFVEEAFVVGNRIKQLLADNVITKYSDCAILLRNSTHFKTYQEVFDYLQIPLQVQVPTKLKDTYFMKLLANLLMLACHFEDEDKFELNRFNYFSLARSELFEIADYQLFEDLIDKKQRILRIDPKIRELLKQLNYSIVNQTNYQIIDNMISLFNIDQKILSSYYVKEKNYVVDYLYNLTATLSDLNIMGSDFVRFIYEIAYDSNNVEVAVLQEKDENSVKMTTIHKSKGLEYQVLFLGGLNNSLFGKKNDGVVSYDKDFGFNFTDKLKYLNNKKIGEVAAIYNEIQKQQRNNNIIKEELRLLYVAITRAERMLFLLTLPDEGSVIPSSYADYLYAADLDSLIKEENKVIHQQQLKEDAYFDALFEKRLYYPAKIDQLEVVKFDFEMDEKVYTQASIKTTGIIEQATKELFEYGTKLHKMLEYLDYKNLALNDNKDIKRLGLTKFDDKLLKDAVTVHNEFNFIDEAQNISGTIDLLAEYDDQIHIIDFKTKNIANEKYQEQLLSYRNYIVKIYPNKVVKCYLYAILTGQISKLNT